MLMAQGFVLSDFIETALAQASYDKLDDGSFTGHIPSCPGVVAFAATLASCEHDLRSTLEDWIVLGLKLGHPLPVLGGIDLNQKPVHASLGAL